MPLLIAALGEFLIFIFKQVVVKFFLFTVIFLLLTQLAPLLSAYLPESRDILNFLFYLPDSVIWFLHLAAFDVTLPMIIIAHFTRFFIRRIPFLG